MNYFMCFAKCRQHLLLTAIDQIASKPESCVSVEGTLTPLLGSCERGGQKPIDFALQEKGAWLCYITGSTLHPQGDLPGKHPGASTTQGCMACCAAGASLCCNLMVMVAGGPRALLLPVTTAAPATCNGVDDIHLVLRVHSLRDQLTWVLPVALYQWLHRRIIESLRMEKNSKITLSNCQPIPTMLPNHVP